MNKLMIVGLVALSSLVGISSYKYSSSCEVDCISEAEIQQRVDLSNAYAVLNYKLDQLNK